MDKKSRSEADGSKDHSHSDPSSPQIKWLSPEAKHLDHPPQLEDGYRRLAWAAWFGALVALVFGVTWFAGQYQHQATCGSLSDLKHSLQIDAVFEFKVPVTIIACIAIILIALMAPAFMGTNPTLRKTWFTRFFLVMHEAISIVGSVFGAAVVTGIFVVLARKLIFEACPGPLNEVVHNTISVARVFAVLGLGLVVLHQTGVYLRFPELRTKGHYISDAVAGALLVALPIWWIWSFLPLDERKFVFLLAYVLSVIPLVQLAGAPLGWIAGKVKRWWSKLRSAEGS